MKRGHTIPAVKLHNSPECRPSSFICRRRIPNTSTRFPSPAKTSARMVHDDCRRPRTVDDIDIRRASLLLGARRSENRTIAHPLRQLTQAMLAPGSLAPTAPLPPARPTRTCVESLFLVLLLLPCPQGHRGTDGECRRIRERAAEPLSRIHRAARLGCVVRWFRLRWCPEYPYEGPPRTGR